MKTMKRSTSPAEETPVKTPHRRTRKPKEASSDASEGKCTISPKPTNRARNRRLSEDSTKYPLDVLTEGVNEDGIIPIVLPSGEKGVMFNLRFKNIPNVKETLVRFTIPLNEMNVSTLEKVIEFSK